MVKTGQDVAVYTLKNEETTLQTLTYTNTPVGGTSKTISLSGYLIDKIKTVEGSPTADDLERQSIITDMITNHSGAVHFTKIGGIVYPISEKTLILPDNTAWNSPSIPALSLTNIPLDNGSILTFGGNYFKVDGADGRGQDVVINGKTLTLPDFSTYPNSGFIILTEEGLEIAEKHYGSPDYMLYTGYKASFKVGGTTWGYITPTQQEIEVIPTPQGQLSYLNVSGDNVSSIALGDRNTLTVNFSTTVSTATLTVKFYGLELGTKLCKAKSLDIQLERGDYDTTILNSQVQTFQRGLLKGTISIECLELNTYVLDSLGNTEDYLLLVIVDDGTDADNYTGFITKKGEKTEAGGLKTYNLTLRITEM